MRRWHLVVSIAVVLASNSEATAQAKSAQPEYVGRWAHKPAWCKNRRGTSDEIPLAFSLGGYQGLDEACRFEKIVGGSGRWQIFQVCSGEGDSHSDRVELAVKGNKLTMSYQNGQKFQFTRCP
ncbi:hypothetical protein [Prosthecomicrobium sp. N25]|uniref:hypothetical protein n=1 Tax=Prosthecomicrobium sp. N25 TaxID=3129254 RepID=UPI003076C090